MNTNTTLASANEVAAYMGTTPAALAQLRYLGRGPTYIRTGHKSIRYRWADVEDFLNARTVDPVDAA